MNTTVELLQKARKQIETGRDNYVCLALKQCCAWYETSALLRRTPEQEACKTLVQWIDDMLEGNGTLEQYLIKKKGGKIIVKLSNEQRLSQKSYMRQLRLKWIDWMIEEYSKES